MISLNMTLSLYGLVALAVVLLTIFAKSHRTMNILAVVLPASYFALTLFTLAYAKLPGYSLGGNYFLIDHLSLYEIIISAVLFLLAALYSRGYIEGSIEIHEMDRSSLKLFYVAFNLLLVTITYAFLSDNLALFWILAELTTAFSAVLIVILNAPKNIGAALKYVFITSTCMLFAFIGLILIFALTHITSERWNTQLERTHVCGKHTFNLASCSPPSFSPSLGLPQNLALCHSTLGYPVHTRKRQLQSAPFYQAA